MNRKIDYYLDRKLLSRAEIRLEDKLELAELQRFLKEFHPLKIN